MMPAAAREPAVIFGRTLLSMDERIVEALLENSKVRIEPKVICNKCNKSTRDADARIVVLGEFRCSECFSNLVRSRKAEFGFPAEQSVTDEEVKGLLKPCNHPFIANLFCPEREPASIISRNPVREG